MEAEVGEEGEATHPNYGMPIVGETAVDCGLACLGGAAANLLYSRPSRPAPTPALLVLFTPG